MTCEPSKLFTQCCAFNTTATIPPPEIPAFTPDYCTAVIELIYGLEITCCVTVMLLYHLALTLKHLSESDMETFQDVIDLELAP